MSAEVSKPVKPLYERPAMKKLEGEDGKAAMAAYIEHYAKLAKTEPSQLNQKLKREAFSQILDEVGALLLQKAGEMSDGDGKVRDFLKSNPLPSCLGDSLTPQIRTYCLLLNGLSQWAISEKLAMDRSLFSGDVRGRLRAMARICPVSGDDLLEEKVELHHPVRDGRPPIPLSKKGHEIVEQWLKPDANDPDGQKLFNFRQDRKPKPSWNSLRTGCMLENGRYEYGEGPTPQNLKRAQAAARGAAKVTGLSPDAMLAIMDKYEAGLSS